MRSGDATPCSHNSFLVKLDAVITSSPGRTLRIASVTERWNAAE